MRAVEIDILVMDCQALDERGLENCGLLAVGLSFFFKAHKAGFREVGI